MPNITMLDLMQTIGIVLIAAAVFAIMISIKDEHEPSRQKRKIVRRRPKNY